MGPAYILSKLFYSFSELIAVNMHLDLLCLQFFLTHFLHIELAMFILPHFLHSALWIALIFGPL